MLLYTIRRAGLAVAILLVSMVILFSLVYLVPGDPASIALGPRASQAMKDMLRAKMGLDQPIFMQLVHFVLNVLRGDLGIDVWSNRSVTTIVAEALPHTLALTLLGIGWAILLGVPLGAYSAVHRNSVVDKFIGIFSVSAIAIPSFIVAIYSLLFISVRLRWLPAIGAGAEGDYMAQARHLILPSFAVGLGWVGYLARLVRASMLEVMGESHIRTARAFGLPERRIVYGYALRIAILPTIALLGVGIGNLLSGAVFAEIVFARPGVGKLTYDAVITRNYPVVMGCVLVTTALYILCTLLADLISAWFDPRVRASF
ncbi:MAG: peptide/nickel transport system permease protein [Rhodospirillaceae bacterium]|jgi:peptide/nickel transport system permease protein|nr:peptide/nickel transport system permease protein [Rhodospirillaceae bacterium]